MLHEDLCGVPRTDVKALEKAFPSLSGAPRRVPPPFWFPRSLFPSVFGSPPPSPLSLPPRARMDASRRLRTLFFPAYIFLVLIFPVLIPLARTLRTPRVP